ncbi:dimethylallyltransferase [bacteria symbiont BFo1 of Frankliniella occidentalis]|uniref:type 1 glutamine amidotransferase domain-containing protein n=1 Tax=Erwinia TaxID=551 RepID=UPI00066451E4|nr:type 1 glutamine amidotransferase domain-containing protein [Erwinia sp. V90_4]KMV69702.1 dimethylallyltransferase [bacteria symbiont BFo1 of Frankliniella occidentalis]PIJ58018.1 type 1 glutamine amidotransferase domain-containing protein [Erwinia sp. OLMDLW33]KYP83838.1 dimethylallyltransferase [bacteria symbiont BFo1 of Frankliniella occidentalis]KYP89216.1 dimethylallyltransferase [bacteria symbiont BFo1 of Frankliniella occidentalis]MDI3441260.1 type 1 glutamine amidotransferase domain
MRILMVLTSHDKLGDSGKKTGFWLEEFAAPYYVFFDAHINVVLASPAGGQPPLDPVSDAPDAQTPDTERFRQDPIAQQALANTQQLKNIDPGHYDAVFYPGGHGPLWDLAEDEASIALIETLFANGKPVAAVCHAPGVLRHARKPDGTPLVAGKRVTGFTNSEEHAVGLTNVVPFLVEDELKKLGGQFEHTDNWGVYVLTDGHLVTGQNPASSAAAAEELLKLLHQ